MKEIKNVSIIGMGALGVMYGSHLAHHMGFDHVTYIMDEKRYEKYKGCLLYTSHFISSRVRYRSP